MSQDIDHAAASAITLSLPMRFTFIDRILEFTPRERIVAVRAVTLGEEYLADHFPAFPVLPGVLMLQTLVEAAGWLVREAEDFAGGPVLLREAKNINYKSFVKPGHLLRVEVKARRLEPGESDFEGSGFCNEDEVIKGRFGLRHLPATAAVAGMTPSRSQADAKAAFALLRR